MILYQWKTLILMTWPKVKIPFVKTSLIGEKHRKHLQYIKLTESSNLAHVKDSYNSKRRQPNIIK